MEHHREITTSTLDIIGAYSSAMMMERFAKLDQAFGCLFRQFNGLETSIGCAAGYLANAKDSMAGHVLVAELSFRSRLAMLRSLFPERSRDRIPLLEEFVKKAHDVEHQRNRFVHSFYWAGPVGSSTASRLKITCKERDGLRLQFEDVTPANVLAVAELAFQLHDKELQNLMIPFPDYTDYVVGFYGFMVEDNARTST